MIEINNLTNFRLDKELFTGIAKKVLKGENRETKTLSLAFVEKQEIKKLNNKFRKKNKPTDVLSFELSVPRPRCGEAGIPVAEGDLGKGFLGEIIICPEIVKENAKKSKTDFGKELIKVFVHGILHLCGYDHEKSQKEAEIMEKKQSHYLKIKNLNLKIRNEG